MSNASGVLLNSQTFKKTLEETSTYQKLSTQIVTPLLINNLGNEESQTIFPKEVVAAIILKVDKNQLASDIEKVINPIYDYIIGEKESFLTTVDLKPYTSTIKNNLKISIVDFYQSLSVCTEAQAQETIANPEKFPTCQISGVDSAQLIKNYNIDQIVAATDTLPTSITVTEGKITTVPMTNLFNNSNSPPEDFFSTLTDNFKSLRNLITYERQAETFLFVIIIFLFVLLAITRFPNLASIFKWFGSAVFSGTILPLVFATIMLIGLKPDTLEKAVLGNNQNLPEFQKNLTSLVSTDFTAFGIKILKGIQLESFVLIIIAIALYLTHLFLEHRNKVQPQKPLDVTIPPTHNISE